MVTVVSDSERGNPLSAHFVGYSFLLAARVLLYAPSHKQNSTYHGLCHTELTRYHGTSSRSYTDRDNVNIVNSLNQHNHKKRIQLINNIKIYLFNVTRNTF